MDLIDKSIIGFVEKKSNIKTYFDFLSKLNYTIPGTNITTSEILNRDPSEKKSQEKVIPAYDIIVPPTKQFFEIMKLAESEMDESEMAKSEMAKSESISGVLDLFQIITLNLFFEWRKRPFNPKVLLSRQIVDTNINLADTKNTYTIVSVFGDIFNIVNVINPLSQSINRFSSKKGTLIFVGNFVSTSFGGVERIMDNIVTLAKIYPLRKFNPLGLISGTALIKHFDLKNRSDFNKKIVELKPAFREIYSVYNEISKAIFQSFDMYIDSIIQDAEFHFDSINKIGINCEMCELGARYKCGGCKRVFYCSADCQKRHWGNLHYKNCA